DTDGMIRHVAGRYDDCDAPEVENCALEGVATETNMFPLGLGIAPDGSIYIADVSWAHTVGRIGPDGLLTTVAGTTRSDVRADPDCKQPGRLATQMCLDPIDVAVGPDGTVYVLDSYPAGTPVWRERILAFGADGRSRLLFDHTRQPANFTASRLSVDANGRLYVDDRRNGQVWAVDSATGWAMPIAGDRDRHCFLINCEPVAEGLPALAGGLHLPRAVTAGPDGTVYVANFASIYRIEPPFPGFDPTGYLVASEDGSEVYEFDLYGRHLRTLDPVTYEPRLSLVYDDNGRLIRLVDAEGGITRIERDGFGRPTAIVGPYGHTTELVVAGEGWLAEVTDPSGSTVRFEYGVGGLLTSSVDPLGFASRYEYDQWGKLVRAVDREDHAKTLSGTRTRTRYTSTIESALGRTKQFEIERDDENQSSTWTTRSPSGAVTTAIFESDAVGTLTYADGTVVVREELPHAVLGMQAPIARLSIDTPGGVGTNITIAQTPSYGDGAAPNGLVTLDEIVEIEGREISSRYDALTRTATVTTPAGRQATTSSDPLGRPLTQQFGGLAPIAYAYDDGRIAGVTVGTGASARSVAMTYGAHGLVES